MPPASAKRVSSQMRVQDPAPGLSASFIGSTTPTFIRAMVASGSGTMAAPMPHLPARSVSRALDHPSPRLLAALAVAGLLWVAVILGSDRSISVTDPLSGHLAWAQDARSYFGFDYGNLYAGRTDWNAVGEYPYSPAFAQLIWPLNQLPWPLF